MVGETNRAPFDLPEAAGELVGGFHTEYSSLKFALFFLAEYVNMVTVSAIATTLFLGGWRAPWPLSAVNDGVLNTGWWPMLWFIVKLCLFLFVFIWLRGTLPRLRYDQFMRFGWKVLIPVGLVYIVGVALMRALKTQATTQGERSLLIAGLGVVLGGALVVYWIYSNRQYAAQVAREVAPPAEIDPFEGGFPVPPLPGQRVIRTSGARPAVAEDREIAAWASVDLLDREGDVDDELEPADTGDDGADTDEEAPRG